eukprot:gene21432-28397_t
MAYVQSKEQDGWRLFFSSTADPSPDIELPDKTDHLELATIARLFHLPIDDACKKLGTCSTKLKKICRQKGLSRIQNRLEKSITPSTHLGKAPPSSPTTPRVMGLNSNQFQGVPLQTPPLNWAYAHTLGSTSNQAYTGAPPTARVNNMHGGGGLSPRNMDTSPALQSHHNNGGPVLALDFSIPHPDFAADNDMLGEWMGQNTAGTNRVAKDEVLDLGRMGVVGQVGQGPLGGSSTSSTNEPAESFVKNDSVLLTDTSSKILEALFS